MSRIIPMTGGAKNSHQRFDVTLGRNAVTIQFAYQTSLEAWAMDIYQNNAPLFAGVMLRVNADMLAAWNVRESFGAMTLIGDEPTLDSLGDANTLVWSSPNELA